MLRKVAMEEIDVSKKRNQSVLICAGEVEGASVYHHTAVVGSSIEFAPDTGYFHILILIKGKALFCTSGNEYFYDERVSFVPAPDKSLAVNAVTDIQVLEIKWKILEDDIHELAGYNTKFPLIQTYADSKQYRDRNKSEKTISRVMIEQRNIPRFCMGSVESYGYDLVKPHGHPMLDQFFFSFPENDMDVLIDGEHIHMTGNVLMHIPLGSDHGVEVIEGKHMHYMWIDFMVDDTAMARLDTSHIATGLMRSFEKENKK
ncbi:MAG: hypothetical protein ABFD25_11310 [Clostridiaceae bacterium]